MAIEMFEYLMLLDNPPKEVGYWPKGIAEAAPGNEQMLASQEKRWLGNIDVLRKEHQSLITVLNERKVPLIVLPYPDESHLDSGAITQDIEFMRDPTITARDGRALALRMGAPSRQKEPEWSTAALEAFDIPVEEMRLGYHEGGNTKYVDVNGTRWYFSGTSSRSDAEGIRAVEEFLGNGTTRHTKLDLVDGLHLDCVFTGIVAEGKAKLFAWMDGFAPGSRKIIEATARDMRAELWPLDKDDADRLTPNGIQWGEHVFSTGKFNRRDVQQAAETGAKVTISPLTQNLHLGGAIHCLSKEVYAPQPIDPKKATEKLQKSGLFTKDGRVRIYNNY